MLDDYKKSQNIAYKIIYNQIEKNKISHAYIIETNKNNDGITFARAFAKALLCPHKYTNLNNCSNCNQCQIIDDNNFIELKIIEPAGLWITKDQIEELQNTFIKKALVGKNKVYIINHAEKIKKNVVDRMLKFIEEPREGIIAILLTDNINNLIDTIVSRCQIISLKKCNLSFTDNVVDNIKMLIDNNKYSEIEINEILIDNVLKFVKYYEDNRINTLLFTKELWHDYFNDLLSVDLALNIMIIIYKEIIDYQLSGQVKILKKYYEAIVHISKHNTLLLLYDKINVIIECEKRIKYNANLTLLIDKLIIDLEKRHKYD